MDVDLDASTPVVRQNVSGKSTKIMRDSTSKVYYDYDDDTPGVKLLVTISFPLVLSPGGPSSTGWSWNLRVLTPSSPMMTQDVSKKLPTA